jgi:3-hydroxy-3-methylglutaryl CoA synthase/uncharacterized OB-fold protein
MAAGIVSYGAYIPIYRMSSELRGQVWAKPVPRGEVAVANYDEDTITMGVEASTDCLANIDRSSVDGLYFASASPVYKEKQNASIIAKTLDLRPEIVTADVGHSLRGATSAMRAAMDSVNAGTAKKFLVIASECRVPAPDSGFEGLFGDGAAAFLLGDSDIAVEIEGSYTISSDFLDIWKREVDRYHRTWEDRFVITHGYVEHLQKAVRALFKKYNVGPKDFSKAVFYGYDARRHGEMARALGFDPAQVQDALLTTVGNTGTASAPMMLVGALEEAKPGDRILFANYGDGVDAFILRVTDQIEKLRDRRGIKKHLDSKMMLPSYGKYLHFRDLMEWEPRRESPLYAALTMSWRDRDWVLSGKAGKCKNCGHTQFPPQRVCAWCQAKDEFELVRIVDRKGTLSTYSMDNLAVSVDPPNVVSIVDLEGDVRFSTIMTDRDTSKITPKMPVELTFRLIHEVQGIRNYFWKCRPIRA